MLFCFGAVNAYAARVVYVKKAPPAPRVVVKKPACPYKKAVWVNGHWTWKKNQYVWVAGHWVKVKPGYRWIDGHWKKTPHGWIYVKGHWAK
ncbi:YXWGXW repeat-containing protein [candidate division KSB1 bacterium]|nr:YXWGXW repeat-containing protein [candidate division KSB1 bacterium]